MFHATLFALLSGLFLLFAFSAARADQIVVAVAALLMALWLGDFAFRAGRGVRRRRRSNRTGTDVDGRQ
ncbi:MAG: hypothetical protein JWM98_3097 [Thermoleophilia bacterium]|nr:hypothetical protein [Thermoleophilia bacterium]